MQAQLGDSEKPKVKFSPSTLKYQVKGFSDEYEEYIDAGHMDNLGWQVACWIVVPIGLILFLGGFSMLMNGVPFELRGTPNIPEVSIVFGAVTIFVGGRLRWMWNPKSAEQFFADNYQLVGGDGEALPRQVIVNYLGKSVFRLTEVPAVEEVGGSGS